MTVLHYYEISCHDDAGWDAIREALKELPGIDVTDPPTAGVPHIGFRAPREHAKRLRLLAQAHGGKLWYGGPADADVSWCRHGIPRTGDCPACGYSAAQEHDALAEGRATGC